MPSYVNGAFLKSLLHFVENSRYITVIIIIIISFSAKKAGREIPPFPIWSGLDFEAKWMLRSARARIVTRNRLADIKIPPIVSCQSASRVKPPTFHYLIFRRLCYQTISDRANERNGRETF